MKKIIMLLCAIVMITINLAAQVESSAEVPAAVEKAFSEKYSDATDVLWEQEKGGWEADFILSGQEYEAMFSADGSWMKTSQEIDPSEIPASVMSALETEVPGLLIDEVEIMQTPSGKFYEIEAELAGKEMTILTDLDGKILQKDTGKDDN